MGVLLGTILAGAILTGALVVGDSVRFSLKQMALARLGQTTLALTSGDRFFRADLAQELARAPGSHRAVAAVAWRGYHPRRHASRQ